jgi:hypothetical protein
MKNVNFSMFPFIFKGIKGLQNFVVVVMQMIKLSALDILQDFYIRDIFSAHKNASNVKNCVNIS